MKNKAELEKFIGEFGLKHPDGMVSFPAKIIYNINEHPRVRYSDVQIITSADLNTVYFLNRNLQPEDLPDIFKSPDDEFIYKKGEGMVIRMKTPGDEVEILPIV